MLWRQRHGVIVYVFLLACLIGCAGTSPQISTQETQVWTYETVAIALNGVKGFIKGQELSGALKGAELDAKIAQWELARQIFLKAGDALKESILAQTPAEQGTKMKSYNDMVQQAGQQIGQLQVWQKGASK